MHKPDCLKIDLNVPKGISFLPAGTITVFVTEFAF
jgi:hypothetical protein